MSSSAGIQQVPKLHLDDFAIEQCKNAVITTFSTMFAIEPELTQIERDAKRTAPTSNEILAFMNIVQERVEGALVLRCGFTTISPIVRNLFGDKNLQQDAADSIGELSNLIFGIMTDTYSRRGFNFQMELPVVIVGPQQKLTDNNVRECVRLNFTTKSGPFFLEMFLLNEARGETHGSKTSA